MVNSKGLVLLLSAIQLSACTPASGPEAQEPVNYSSHHNLAIWADGAGAISNLEIQNVATERAINRGYSTTNNQDVETVLQLLRTEENHKGEFRSKDIGQLVALGVDGILYVQVTGYSNNKMNDGSSYISNISLSARLIDTRSARIEWIKNVEEQNPGLAIGLAGLALSILMPVNQKSSTERLIDNVLLTLPYAPK